MKKINKIRVILLMLAVSSLVGATVSTTDNGNKPEKKWNVYYISPDGQDNNAGTFTSPWKTFMHATLQLRAGDTLYVRGGVYTGHDAISTVRAYDEAIDGIKAQSIYEDGTLGDAGVWWAPGFVSRHPYNSGLFLGTEDAPIVIKAYQHEKPVLQLVTPFMGEIFLCALFGVSWWVIDGLTFLDCTYNNEFTGGGQRAIVIYKSDHVTIQNCVFDNQDDVPFRVEPERRSAEFISLFLNSNITIRGCYFNGCGANLLFNGDPDAVYIGACEYVLIEGNYFGNAGHSGPAAGGHYINDLNRWFYRDHKPMFGSALLPEQKMMENSTHTGFQKDYKLSMYVVCQNNIVDNHFGGGIYIGGQYVLIQNNLIYHAGHQVDYVKTALYVSGTDAIHRNNIMVAANYEDKGPNAFLPKPRQSVYQQAVYLGGFTYGGISHNLTGHRLYNNVAYRSGWAALYIPEVQGTKVRNNIFKNNIFFENNVRHKGAGEPEHAASPPAELLFYGFAVQEGYFNQFPFGNCFFNNIIKSAKASDPSLVGFMSPGIGEAFEKSLKQVETDYPWGFANNIEKDPQFVAPAPKPAVLMTENFDTDNYRLTAGSPAINAGADLTTVIKAGVNVTKVYVEDARYFCDGFGLIQGDPVKIGRNAIARIVKADYENNELTLSKPVTVKAGDAVNLPYNGTSPDIGAYQYTATPEILVDTYEVKKNILTLMGVISSDWGNQVLVRVFNSKGQTVYTKQSKSGNAGSFRFEIPLPARDTYKIVIGGTAVQSPAVLTYKY